MIPGAWGGAGGMPIERNACVIGTAAATVPPVIRARRSIVMWTDADGGATSCE
ncbi:hypothetical protein P0F65_06440 [Sphingomonas sp. I4]